MALFRRAAGRVSLTDAGRRLHGHARRILDLTAEAHAAVTATRAAVGGDLTLAASSVPGEHLLPHTLAAFRRHPRVRVRVAAADTDAVLREVEKAGGRWMRNSRRGKSAVLGSGGNR